MKNPIFVAAALAAAVALSACSGSSAPASASAVAARTYETIVDETGAISRPTDFVTNPAWIHLGAWAVVNDNGDGNSFHNVYTTRDVVEHYRATGAFPDGAVLIKEVRGLHGAALTTGHARWAGEEAVWFVSVKDKIGRFPSNPLWGDGWGWALFKADDPAKQVATDYKEDCLGCHLPAKASDYSYVYAYPTLGAQAARHAPNEAPSMMRSAMAAPDEATSMAAADGKAAFEATCAACHSLRPGEHRVGPSLAGIIGRAAGAAPGFGYSDAMKASGLVWSAETLDAFLGDVDGYIVGNRMGQLFPAGVKDAGKRAQIITYLRSASQ